MLQISDLFEVPADDRQWLFTQTNMVFDALPRIGEYAEMVIAQARDRGQSMIRGEVEDGAVIENGAVIVAEGARVENGATVLGPTVIGAGTTVRQGAYIRGRAVIGRDCVVGHCTELKNTILLDSAKAPHFNYVGDSILGHRTNLGAGTKISNVKVVDGPIKIRVNGEVINTGLRKFGAIVGDDVQTGCNSVLNPGTLLGRGSVVYPCALCRGYYSPRSLVKVDRDTFTVEQLRN